jgi:bifunctional non-homologous end joining protein LigD
MLAQPARLPEHLNAFRTGGWSYQRKLDGLRCIAMRRAGEVTLWSRNRSPWTARFPGVVSALRALPLDEFVLDGEIVVFSGDRTSFALLQNPGGDAVPVYSLFDALDLLGHDIRGLPLTERTALLDRAVTEPSGALRRTEQVEGEPQSLLEEACARGWEGLIAKRSSGPYRAGRSPDWRKLKCSASQELVIAGWSEPSGSRIGFGALLMGYYEPGGLLRYAGKVGTGFDQRLLRQLYRDLKTLEIDRSPFEERIPAKGVHWVRPELVAQVEFTEWTADGKLRHPRFSGLRTDKAARDVVREDPSTRARAGRGR